MTRAGYVPEDPREIATQEWRNRALCSGMDPEIFFPHKGEADKTAYAKSLCDQCDVKEECLDFAVTIFHTPGIWGGTSERERRNIRKIRGIARRHS